MKGNLPLNSNHVNINIHVTPKVCVLYKTHVNHLTYHTTMSLVAKIHHQSPISNWFAERHNDTIHKIINEANQKLGHTPIQTNSPHRGFIKAIGLYALLRHLGYVNNRYWLKDTYAETYISKSKDGLFDEYFKPHDKILEEAMACVIAASLDLSYRNSHEHEFVKPFIRALRSGTEVKTDKKWASEWTSTIDEAKEIVGNIARCWHSRGLKSDEVILNCLTLATASVALKPI